MDFFKKWQTQSEEKRKAMMKLFVVLGSILVFFIWLLLLPFSLKKNKVKESEDWLKKIKGDLSQGMIKENFFNFQKNIEKMMESKEKIRKEAKTKEKKAKPKHLPLEK